MSKKVISALAVLLSVILLLCGCSSGKLDSKTIARVEGNDIPLKDYLSYYEDAADYYGIDLEDTSAENLEEISSFQSMLLDALIGQEVLMVKAKELGLDALSEEETKQVEEKVQSSMSDAEKSIREEVTQKYPDATEGEINIYVKTEMATEGYVEDDVRKNAIKDVVYQHILEYMMSDVSVSDEELKDAFTKKVESAKASYENGSGSYEYDMGYDGYAYYTPENVILVKEILITMIDEDYDELVDIYYEEGENSDAFLAKKEEALANIQDKAQGVLERINEDGSNFDEIYEECNEDPYAQYNPEGYYVYLDGTAYDEEYMTAAKALTNIGDFTGLVPTTDGYVIIRLVQRVTPGPIDFETVKDDLEETLRAEKEDSVYYDKLNAWRDEMKVVINEELLASLMPKAGASATVGGADEPTAVVVN